MIHSLFALLKEVCILLFAMTVGATLGWFARENLDPTLICKEAGIVHCVIDK